MDFTGHAFSFSASSCFLSCCCLETIFSPSCQKYAGVCVCVGGGTAGGGESLLIRGALLLLRWGERPR